jgi:hypothetical protein
MDLTWSILLVKWKRVLELIVTSEFGCEISCIGTSKGLDEMSINSIIEFGEKMSTKTELRGEAVDKVLG